MRGRRRTRGRPSNGRYQPWRVLMRRFSCMNRDTDSVRSDLLDGRSLLGYGVDDMEAEQESALQISSNDHTSSPEPTSTAGDSEACIQDFSVTISSTSSDVPLVTDAPVSMPVDTIPMFRFSRPLNLLQNRASQLSPSDEDMPVSLSNLFGDPSSPPHAATSYYYDVRMPLHSDWGNNPPTYFEATTGPQHLPPAHLCTTIADLPTGPPPASYDLCTALADLPTGPPPGYWDSGSTSSRHSDPPSYEQALCHSMLPSINPNQPSAASINTYQMTNASISNFPLMFQSLQAFSTLRHNSSEPSELDDESLDLNLFRPAHGSPRNSQTNTASESNSERNSIAFDTARNDDTANNNARPNFVRLETAGESVDFSGGETSVRETQSSNSSFDTLLNRLFQVNTANNVETEDVRSVLDRIDGLHYCESMQDTVGSNENDIRAECDSEVDCIHENNAGGVHENDGDDIHESVRDRIHENVRDCVLENDTDCNHESDVDGIHENVRDCLHENNFDEEEDIDFDDGGVLDVPEQPLFGQIPALRWSNHNRWFVGRLAHTSPLACYP